MDEVLGELVTQDLQDWVEVWHEKGNPIWATQAGMINYKLDSNPAVKQNADH